MGRSDERQAIIEKYNNEAKEQRAAEAVARGEKQKIWAQNQKARIEKEKKVKEAMQKKAKREAELFWMPWKDEDGRSASATTATCDRTREPDIVALPDSDKENENLTEDYTGDDNDEWYDAAETGQWVPMADTIPAW